MPYYAFKHDETFFMRNDELLCSGSCMKYLNSQILFGWENHYQENINKETAEGFYDSRECNAEDIGEELYEQGTLFICPPKDGLVIQNRAFSFPNKYFSFGVIQKNTN